MDITASLEAPCAAEQLFELVDDLSTYPQWNGLVHTAVAEPGDAPVWDVELRARLGPLARSKRLRMVRTVRDPVSLTVRFERDQADGRNHSPWVLRAAIVEQARHEHPDDAPPLRRFAVDGRRAGARAGRADHIGS